MIGYITRIYMSGTTPVNSIFDAITTNNLVRKLRIESIVAQLWGKLRYSSDNVSIQIQNIQVFINGYDEYNIQMIVDLKIGDSLDEEDAVNFVYRVDHFDVFVKDVYRKYIITITNNSNESIVEYNPVDIWWDLLLIT